MVNSRSSVLLRLLCGIQGLLLCALLVQPSATRAEGLPGRQEAGTALYVRMDSDETTVVTPRLRVASELSEGTRAELTYSVDVWSSASIDIRTSASRALTRQHKRVIEQRDELNASLSQELADLRLAVGYRYSNEPDYVSHGGSLGVEYDFAGKAATAALSGQFSLDDVGRVGSPDFSRSLDSVGMRASFTQVIDRESLAQLSYELNHANGYLSSPYRLVGIGTDDGTCQGEFLYCLPEANPERRVRHAIALMGRRSLASQLSVGGSYRYYFDDWDIASHTANLNLSWLFLPESVATLRYRYYWQTAASHYRVSYEELTEQELYTRDKELSPLHAHRVALDVERAFEIGELDERLTAVLSVGPTFYEYRNYALLDSITAWEATLSMGLEL